MTMSRLILLPLMMALLHAPAGRAAEDTILISEISDKGTARSASAGSGIAGNDSGNDMTIDCAEDEDWIELYNPGTQPVDLSSGPGYVLYDDKGVDDEDAFRFSSFSSEEDTASYTILDSGQYLVLCCSNSKKGITSDPILPGTKPKLHFKIGTTDTITLAKVLNGADGTAEAMTNSSVEIVSSVGPLPGNYSAFDITYALDFACSSNNNTVTSSGGIFGFKSTRSSSTAEAETNTNDCYSYTSTPTPGFSNIMSAPAEPQTDAEKEEWIAMGKQFFNMDERGYAVASTGDKNRNRLTDTIVDLHLDMKPEDFEEMMTYRERKEYMPFQTASITTMSTDGGVEPVQELVQFTSPGRIRTRGVSSLVAPTCIGTDEIPFLVDFSNTNSSQHLFGLDKIYLRTNFLDNSGMRDFVYYRMLARWGLPHVRTRRLRLFINNEQVGALYTAMERPHSEVVFARNYPDHDPDNFAIFKARSAVLGCGDYSEEELTMAQDRLDAANQAEAATGVADTTLYRFQRGSPQEPITVLSILDQDGCQEVGKDVKFGYRNDSALAYLRHDNNCGEMYVEEGLFDRKIGTKNWDKPMEEFINEHLIEFHCEPGCANSDLPNQVDQESFLKTAAFYSVLQIVDSPVVEPLTDDLFFIQTGENGGGWKLFPFDFNRPFPAGECYLDVCDQRFADWSIVRPTCQAPEESPLFGPFLANPEFHGKYLEYARDFTSTVLNNATFIQEIHDHLVETAPELRKSLLAIFGMYLDGEDGELSMNPLKDHYDHDFPLIPLMLSRGESLTAQFAAIDDGSFPMDVPGPWDTCVDWRQSETNRSKCEQSCFYEGCHMPGWTVESFCDEGEGICYHGNKDQECQGILDGEQYSGMKATTEYGLPLYCQYAGGVPSATSECPAPGVVKSSPVSDSSSSSSVSSSSSRVSRSIPFAAIALSILCVAL